MRHAARPERRHHGLGRRTRAGGAALTTAALVATGIALPTAAHADESHLSEAQAQVLVSDLLSLGLAEAGSASATFYPTTSNSPGSLDLGALGLLNLDVGGLGIELLDGSGGGLLQLGGASQLGAMESIAIADSPSHAYAGAGTVTDSGAINLDPNWPDENITPTTFELTALFDQLGLSAVTDLIIDDLSLQLGAIASEAELTDGTLETGYMIADLQLQLHSDLIETLTADLQGTVTGVGDLVDSTIGADAALTGLLTNLNTTLESVTGLLGGLVTVDASDATVAVDGLDAALQTIADGLLAQPLSDELVTIDLASGTITVDLAQLAAGDTLNGQDPNTSLLSAGTLSEVTTSVTTLLGGLVGDLQAALETALTGLEVTVNVPLQLALNDPTAFLESLSLGTLLDVAGDLVSVVPGLGALVDTVQGLLGLVPGGLDTSVGDVLGVPVVGAAVQAVLNAVVGALNPIINATVGITIPLDGSATDVTVTADLAPNVTGPLVDPLLALLGVSSEGGLAGALEPAIETAIGTVVTSLTATVNDIVQNQVLTALGPTLTGVIAPILNGLDPVFDIVEQVLVITINHQPTEPPYETDAYVDGSNEFTVNALNLQVLPLTGGVLGAPLVDLSLASSSIHALSAAPSITVTDPVFAGEDAPVTGTGWAPETTVTLTLVDSANAPVLDADGDPITTTVTTDTAGAFPATATFPIPEGTAPGEYGLTAADGAGRTAADTFTVYAPTASTDGIAFAGTSEPVTSGVWPAGTEVTVTLGSGTPVSTTIDADGTLPDGFTIPIPAGTSGVQTVTVADADGHTAETTIMVYDPSVTASDPIRPGETLPVTGEGFPPSTDVVITVVDPATGATIGTPIETTTGTDGALDEGYLIPVGTLPGDYEVVVTMPSEPGIEITDTVTVIPYTPSVTVTDDTAFGGDDVPFTSSGWPVSTEVTFTATSPAGPVLGADGQPVTVTVTTGTDGTIPAGTVFPLPEDAVAGEYTLTGTAGDVTASDAFAVYAPTTTVDGVAYAGTDEPVAGAGWPAGITVTVSLDGVDGAEVTGVVIDADGTLPDDLVLPIPAGTVGNHTVTVTDADGHVSTASLAVYAPTVDAIDPVAPGGSLPIEGDGFPPSIEIEIVVTDPDTGEVVGTPITVVTTPEGTIPDGTVYPIPDGTVPGDYDVIVTEPGSDTAIATDEIGVYAPTIAAADPVFAGDAAEITGAGWPASSEVTLELLGPDGQPVLGADGQPMTVTISTSPDGEVLATALPIPATATPGTYSVRATADGDLLAIDEFAVYAPTADVTGPVYAGGEAPVTSEGWPPNTPVTVTLVDADGQPIVDDQGLIVQVSVTTDGNGALPAGTAIPVPAGLEAGTYGVVVADADGHEAEAEEFIYAPTVTAGDPVLPGEDLPVTGGGFPPNTTVEITVEDGDGTVIGEPITVLTDENGDLPADVVYPIPADTIPGDYQLVAVDITQPEVEFTDTVTVGTDATAETDADATADADANASVNANASSSASASATADSDANAAADPAAQAAAYADATSVASAAADASAAAAAQAAATADASSDASATAETEANAAAQASAEAAALADATSTANAESSAAADAAATADADAAAAAASEAASTANSSADASAAATATAEADSLADADADANASVNANASSSASASATADSDANAAADPAAQAAAYADATSVASAAADASAAAAAQAAAIANASSDASATAETEANAAAQASAEAAALADATSTANADASASAGAAATADADAAAAAAAEAASNADSSSDASAAAAANADSDATADATATADDTADADSTADASASTDANASASTDTDANASASSDGDGGIWMDLHHPVRTHGDEQIAYGYGFLPGEAVTGTMYSEPHPLGTQIADANGEVTFTWSIQEHHVVGEHRVELVGETSGMVFEHFHVVSRGAGLATTGGGDQALPLGILGASILIVGAAIWFGSRRRSSIDV